MPGKADDGESELVALRQQVAELTRTTRRLTEAVEARDALLAIAGHELRNPMTPILGRVDMLRRQMARPDFSHEKVNAGLQHLHWLIGRFVRRTTTLLDVSRINSGRLEFAVAPVDIGALVRQVVDNFRPLAAITDTALTADVPAREILALGDALALEVIFDNLVSNALKYGVGKPVTACVAIDPIAQVVEVSVTDFGLGISAADQARIFERFERAVPQSEHRGGYGLGLWIVRHLAETMGGRIAIDSEAGVGSTFCVSLPLDSSGGPA